MTEQQISNLQVIINDMDWLVKMNESATPETLEKWAGELARIENER